MSPQRSWLGHEHPGDALPAHPDCRCPIGWAPNVCGLLAAIAGRCFMKDNGRWIE